MWGEGINASVRADFCSCQSKRREINIVALYDFYADWSNKYIPHFSEVTKSEAM